MIATKNKNKDYASRIKDGDTSFITVNLLEDFENSITGTFVRENAVGSKPLAESAGFNYSKLQALLCMVASAAASVGLIMWAINFF